MNEKLISILEKHKAILDNLTEERVVKVDTDSNGNIVLREMCDEWFAYVLTKTDCKELSEMFAELADLF